MAQYLTPGVYMEEIPGTKPIEGVGTATGAFVGIAEKGPIGEAKLITNMTQYFETFGGYISYGYLTHAVNQFFSEGGTKCYVVRTCHYNYSSTPASPQAVAGTIELMDRAATPLATIKIEALSPGSWSDNTWVEITDSKKDPTNKFNMAVWYKDKEAENYDELTVSNVSGKVNDSSKYIEVTNLGSLTSSPNNRPEVSAYDINDRQATPSKTLRVTALAKGLTVEIEDEVDAQNNPVTTEFKLIIKQNASTVETFRNLTKQNIVQKVDGVSKYVKVENLATSTDLPNVHISNTLKFFALNSGWDGLIGKPLQDRTTPTPPDTLVVSSFKKGVEIEIKDDPDDSVNKFVIIVKYNAAEVEVFKGLTMANVEPSINGRSEYIEVNIVTANQTAPPDNRPLPGTHNLDAYIGLADMDFIGDALTKNGLHAFDPVDDINIVAIPDWPGDREVILAGLTYCQNRRDCFFVADTPAGLDPQNALDFKQGTGNYAGNAFNSSYGALYYPWIYKTDPLTGKKKLVPPSGAVAGTYSGTDVIRGVHKAPAGTIDGYLNSSVGIEEIVTKNEQELLNPEHVNVIRKFPGAGIVIWGARTLSADPEFRYINVRRLLLFIEESIEDGSQWVVFEPNDRSLWATVKRDVTAFLSIVWKSGALFGATPEEAFFVKIDDENNPQEVRDAGRLIIDIGVAPVKPAEFVIFRISQKTQATG